MINLKRFIEEYDYDARMAEQKKRKSEEAGLENRLSSHYTHGSKHGETLKNYTNFSGKINSHLWEEHKGNKPQTDDKTLGDIKAMDTATHAQRTPEAFTAYSTSRHDPREHKDTNGVMYHPAFLSTSIRKSVPEGQYGNRNVTRNSEGKSVHNIYKIDIPKDHPGMYISDRNSIDKNAKEFVLPRGTKLKHINTHTDESSSNIRHEHHMQVLPESDNK